MYTAGWIISTKIKRMINGRMDNDGQVLKWIHCQILIQFASLITEWCQVPRYNNTNKWKQFGTQQKSQISRRLTEMSLFIEEKQTRFLICDVINQRQKE